MFWLGSHELSTLVGFLFLTAGLWIFVELAGEVRAGETQHVDRTILLSLRDQSDLSDPWGPRWVEELVRDMTALGGIGVLTLITLAVVGYLLLQRNNSAALLVLVAVLGGLVVSYLLKWQFARPRPDLVPHGSHVLTASFPSGHAMMSATTYLTLGALLARVHTGRRLKAYFLLLAALLSISVGMSRVYLGVHWPSDVLAGWTLGACWAILCWMVTAYLQRQGDVVSTQPEPSAPD
ncbi:phosphatidylglycerophosphatase B [Symmachiella macrocystis]|uniref:Phosphatidylglycerophosphatase B n=2 Tax=Symmachiella macrocystis TaxID=2527985 RepID=A0A5C6BQJ3_9PLAN|nr:phosphatidylglycerophosphatase B [Symmachiella macrocystis]